MILERAEQQVNIHQLVLKEPKKRPRLSFDPEREISERDWLAIEGTKDNLKREIEEGGSEGPAPLILANLVANIRILSPSRAEETGLNEDCWRRVKQTVAMYRDQSIFGFYLYGVVAKRAFPKRVAELNLDGNIWEEVKADLRERQAENENIIERAADAKLLFSERFNEFWPEIKDGVTSGELGPFRREGLWHIFIKEAACFRILFPHEKDPFGLNQDDWYEMRGSLERPRQNKSWSALVEQAACMKILVAEEVKITDQGLEIIMSGQEPEFQPGIQPLPVQRRF